MKRKKQFSGVTKPRTFFDRKVQRTSTTRLLSMGKVIPKDWRYVRIRIIATSKSFITMTIEKLLGEEVNAPAEKNNKGSKQNTPGTRPTNSN